MALPTPTGTNRLIPRLLPALAGVLILTGCGYIGDPLPPLANVPVTVANLAAVQRGSKLIAQFTIPAVTTENKPIPKPLTLDLRAGPSPSEPFDINQWATAGRHFPAPDLAGPIARYEIPIAGEWTGKGVILAVRVTGGNGKQTAWSNFALVQVVPAPEMPSAVTPAAAPDGVRLTWQARGSWFRVFRKAEPDSDFVRVADVQQPAWTDTTAEYGKRYAYVVQTIAKLEEGKEAESDLSVEAPITPEDKFAPAAPTGLAARSAPASIELAWDRNPEPDLNAYRIYRATAGAPFEKLADVSVIPTYSDHAVEPGKIYQYVITALDRTGNESNRSTPASAQVNP